MYFWPQLEPTLPTWSSVLIIYILLTALRRGKQGKEQLQDAITTIQINDMLLRKQFPKNYTVPCKVGVVDKFIMLDANPVNFYPMLSTAVKFLKARTPYFWNGSRACQSPIITTRA